MILEKINNSYIYYTEEQHIHTREYYNYCTSLLKNYLQSSQDNINIIFGDYHYHFDNDNKVIKVQIQFEHTLVKQGGRGLNGDPKGNIAIGDDFYHVRIVDFHKLNRFDIVIDYSIPNIENISSCDIFKDFSQKTVYISPILYEYDGINSDRDIKCVTLFHNIYEPRRKKLLDNIHLREIESYNITNCFSSEDIKNLYSRTKILLNIRQTDHHHTFEELRVLPALLNGVIVISEDVPLRDKIPYNEFIIWCKYDDILDKLKEVEDNYEYYWNSIFSSDRLYKTIEKIKLNNQDNIFNIINKNKKLI